MPAITLTDLNNAKTDVEHIADIATSTAPTATDRLGHVKKTMQGASDDVTAKVAAVEAAKTTALADIAIDVASVESAKTAAIADINQQVTDTEGVIVAAVDAAVAETLAAKVAIDNRFYPGTYAADPTTRPDGSACQEGDEYFNSVSDLKLRFNGSTWVASDISTANLAATSGASLVGFDGGTVQDVLDDAKPMASYTALRAYTGRATGVWITSAGVAGFFARSATDATSADNGGTIIVDGAGRRWLRLFAGAINVKWFGAVGDGVTADTAGIQAAITACGASGITKLCFPAGTYLVTSQFIVSTPIMFIGEGAGYQAHAGFPATVGTRIKWGGGATAVVVFENINYGGFGMWGIDIDCAGVATNALIVSDSVGGTFEDVGLSNYATRGLWLRSTATYAANTNSWHRFRGLNIGSTILTAAEAMRLSGFPAMGNACHITFDNTRITHVGSAHGIVLGGCDNVTFTMTYIYRAPGGTGRGVYIDTTENPGFPMANCFYHLQAGDGGYYQPAASAPYHACQIWGYALDNGQPPVYAPNGGVSGMTNAGQPFGARSFGKTVGNNFTFAYEYAAGAASRVVSLPTPEPDANYLAIIIPGQQIDIPVWVASYTASGFTLHFSADPGGTVFVQFLIVRV